MNLITQSPKRKKKGPGLWLQSPSPFACSQLVIPAFAAGCNVLPTVTASRYPKSRFVTPFVFATPKGEAVVTPLCETGSP